MDAQSGSLDSDFKPNIAGGLGAVFATAVQPDGKILIGGSFGTVPPSPLLTPVAPFNIARLDVTNNGATENAAAFNIGTGAGNSVYCLAVQPDLKILMAGHFLDVNGTPRVRIARLNRDGTLDSTFNAGAGPNDLVNCMALQRDGKIVIGGLFTSMAGHSCNHIARLNADGSVESTATFDPGSGAADDVYTVSVQEDDRILLGGLFTSVNGQPRNNIARLNPNGSVEDIATFNPGSGANNRVYCIALQADRKILLGGIFTSVNGQPLIRIARLNTNGSVESTATFNPDPVDNYYVSSMAVQADGRILLGGGFLTVRGLNRSGIARLNADGTVDTTFDPGTGTDTADANGVAIQADGKVLLAGQFTTFNGTARNLMARLSNAIPTLTLSATATQVQWQRGGTAPEISQVTFDCSNDVGVSWSNLGNGTRVAGGWQLGGLSLMSTVSIRARGRTIGGYFNGSSGIVEQTQAITLLPAMDYWRQTYFGSPSNSGNGADSATPDQDGIRNLLKYALVIPPGSSGAAALPIGQKRTYLEGNRLAIVFKRDPARNDIALYAEAADSPAGPWTNLASSLNGAPMSGPGLVGETDVGGGVRNVEVRDLVNLGNAPRRFLHIRVVH